MGGLLSQLSMLVVLSPDFDLGQMEHGLNGHRKFNVLLGQHGSLYIPYFLFFYVPNTKFLNTKLFQKLPSSLLVLTSQKLYFSCLPWLDVTVA